MQKVQKVTDNVEFFLSEQLLLRNRVTGLYDERNKPQLRKRFIDFAVARLIVRQRAVPRADKSNVNNDDAFYSDYKLSVTRLQSF